VREHYKNRIFALRENQKKTFRKLGLDSTVVRTDEPYMKPLRELFARRARKAYR
jgi:hypothetical protein